MNRNLKRLTRAASAVLGLGLAASSIALIGPAAPSSAAEQPGVVVTIAPADRGIAQPGQDLTVQISLENTGQQPVGAGSLRLTVDDTRIETRAELASWLTPPTDGSAPEPSDDITVDVPTPELAVGLSQTVTAVVPSDELWPLQDWGVYGLDASLDDGGDAQVIGRSSIVWNDGTAPAPVSLSIAMPITTQPGQTGLIPQGSLATMTGEAGLLTRQLDAAIDKPVAIFLDPRIVASINALGSSAPATATEWLARLEHASNPIYPLSYADSDLAGQSQAGAPMLYKPTSFAYALDPANFQNEPTTDPTSGDLEQPGDTSDATAPGAPGSSTPDTAVPTPTATDGPATVPDLDSLLAWNYTATSIGWPRPGTVTGKDLTFFAGNGLTSSILSSTNVAFPDGATPAGVATIDSSTVLVSDSTVSAALRAASSALTASASANALAELSSSLAVVADEAGAKKGAPNPVILATLDRDWPADGNAVTEALGSLSAMPWASPVAFSQFAAQPPVTGAAMVDSPEPADRITTLSGLLQTDIRVGTFSSVFEQPELFSGSARSDLLALMANSWAANPGGWNVAVATNQNALGKSLSSISIVDGSPVTLAGTTGNLKVLVKNDLTTPVTVILRVVPSNGRLVVDSEVSTTIEASSSKNASIPVRATVATGNVTLRVELVSPAGGLVSEQPTFIPMTVHADWETVGSWIVGSLVGLLLLVAVIRYLRKRRRGGERAPDAGDTPSAESVAGTDAPGPQPADPPLADPTGSNV
jgi:hypothetical protein